jgi:hypothetical protein
VHRACARALWQVSSGLIRDFDEHQSDFTGP